MSLNQLYRLKAKLNTDIYSILLINNGKSRAKKKTNKKPLTKQNITRQTEEDTAKCLQNETESKKVVLVKKESCVYVQFILLNSCPSASES